MPMVSAQYPQGTPEDLGRSVFQALQKNDEAGLLSMVHTKKEMLIYIGILPVSERKIKEYQREQRRTWSKDKREKEKQLIYKMGLITKQVDFSNTTLGDISVKVGILSTGASASSKERATIEVKFEGDKSGTLLLDGIMFMDQRWVLDPVEYFFSFHVVVEEEE